MPVTYSCKKKKYQTMINASLFLFYKGSFKQNTEMLKKNQNFFKFIWI